MKFATLNNLEAYEGKAIGTSDWLTVTQDSINDFAQATGDFQWIHTDVARAKRESPFKNTIAHGYMTLSLIGKFVLDLVEVQSLKSVLNYGINKARFTNPVPCGSRVRLKLALKQLNEIKTGHQAIFDTILELEGSERPAVVAEILILMMA